MCCRKGVPPLWQDPYPGAFPGLEITWSALAFAFAWPIYERQPLYIYFVNAFYIFLLMIIALIDWRYRLIFPVMIWAGCMVAIVAP